MLAHVIDCATLEPGRDPLTDLEVIEHELAEYVPHGQLGGLPLAERVRVVILNKADVPEARELADPETLQQLVESYDLGSPVGRLLQALGIRP